MAVEAAHPGVCPGCDTRYAGGTLIRRHDDGWGHVVCPDPLTVTQAVCPTCWLAHPVGACDR